MPDDLYNDDPPAVPETAESGENSDQPKSKSAILPKSCFPEAKPGDSLTVKVTRVNEQDIEVEPEGCKEDEQEQPPEEAAPPSDDGGGMRSMLED